MAHFSIDLIEGRPLMALCNMDDDAARTIYFALCNERDKVVADIASYHNFAEKYYQHCETHSLGEPNLYCERCLEVADLRIEGHKRERSRDEDLMFLGEYLNKITSILFELGANNTPEFDSWLSV